MRPNTTRNIERLVPVWCLLLAAMRRSAPLFWATVPLTARMLALRTASSTPPRTPGSMETVVLKSLQTDLRVDGKSSRTRGGRAYHRFKVEKTKKEKRRRPALDRGGRLCS